MSPRASMQPTADLPLGRMASETPPPDETVDARGTRPSTGSGRAATPFEIGSATARAELVEARSPRKSVADGDGAVRSLPTVHALIVAADESDARFLQHAIAGTCERLHIALTPAQRRRVARSYGPEIVIIAVAKLPDPNVDRLVTELGRDPHASVVLVVTRAPSQRTSVAILRRADAIFARATTMLLGSDSAHDPLWAWAANVALGLCCAPTLSPARHGRQPRRPLGR